MFSTKDYWNNRLSQNYSLTGVGDITLGKYNYYLYKIRKDVFNRLVRKLKINKKDSIVADVGSGTGFYINLWNKVGVKEIHGFDISDYAISQLKERFSESHFFFKQLDVADKVEKQEKTFDIITSFDVLFHIVDDKKFEQAFLNVKRMLNDDGYFIFSDNLIRGNSDFRIEHQVSRKETFVLQTLENAGFRLEYRTPMFYLMNTSFYPKNMFQKYSFPIITRLIIKFPKLVNVMSWSIHLIELVLVRICKKTRSTEIVVCKKVRTV